MSGFRTVMILPLLSALLKPSSVQAAEVGSLELCYTYEFHGRLSENLKSPPKLSTHSPSGLEIEITISPQSDKELALIGLRGKFVTAKVALTSQASSRSYTGQLSDVTISKSPGLGSGTGDMKAKKISKTKIKDCPAQ